MGEVYRATDTALKRDVAVKVLPESFASDKDRLARFQREAEVLASLNHSNIVKIYGLESPDGTKIALVVGSVLPASDPPPDIYIFDLETENLTQLTFDAQGDDSPVWSRDGSRIFFRSYRDGEGTVGAVYAIPANGGTAEFRARSGTGQNPLPWSMSPDDKQCAPAPQR